MHHSDPAYGALQDYISARIWGSPRAMPLGNIMAAVADGRVNGAAVFHNYNPDAETIEISAAADNPRWLTRPILREMFGFAFDQLACQAVILRCDPANDRLGRILTAYGFTRYDIPRLRGRDKAEAIFLLADDAWRANGFHKDNGHEKRTCTHTAA